MIGGKTQAHLQTKFVTKNDIGEGVEAWVDISVLTGFIDLSNGDSKYTNFDSKIQESTHVFICDYSEIDTSASNKRMIVNGKTYDVLLIDDPMELHKHLEIYLKYVGA